MNQNITHPGQIKLPLIDYSKVKYNKSEGYTHQVLGIACQLIMIYTLVIVWYDHVLLGHWNLSIIISHIRIQLGYMALVS